MASTDLTTLYGIPNCDQVKKARTWLDANGVPYTFHDFKKAGVARELIAEWLEHLPWETLVNRKGTTWRALPEARKAAIVDAASATELMLESPSIIKRPVLCLGPQAQAGAHCGFDADLYQRLFKK